MQIVLPASHKRTHTRRTHTSLTAFARLTWGRLEPRDVIFTPLPFTRVLAAWLGIFGAIRVNDVVRDGVLAPVFGGTAAMVITTMLCIVSALAVTRPLFRAYSGQWAGTLVWYGFVMAALTVIFETLFAVYVQERFGYEILARYNVLKGQLWVFVVLTVGLTPLLWARWAE